MIDWQPIETAPKDGTNVLVYYVRGGVPVVHIAWYDSPDEWEKLAENGLVLDSREEWVGWWSYTRGSVTQEKLDDWQTPTHWAPYNGPKEGAR